MMTAVIEPLTVRPFAPVRRRLSELRAAPFGPQGAPVDDNISEQGLRPEQEQSGLRDLCGVILTAWNAAGA